MSWADTQAVVAVAQTVPALSSKTFVTLVQPGPQLTLPYLIVHPSAGVDEATRVTGPRVTENPMFTFHVVGSSANQVQVIVDLLKAKFVVGGFVVPPAVTGRKNTRGYWRSPIPLQIDTDVTPALVYAVVELGWVSEPVPVTV